MPDPVLKLSKATIVYPGMFSASVKEVNDLEVVIKPYAQHSRALHVSYREKRARKRTGSVFYHKTEKTFDVCIIDGWHDIALAPAFAARADGSQITRYASFAPEIATETWEAIERFRKLHPDVNVHSFE
jgi:hypothetical protein